jgi:integrase
VQKGLIEVINDLSEVTEKPLVSWVSNPYVKAATSENTRIAYRSDIHHFEAWGGRLPASPEQVAIYLQAYAPHLNARTLARRLTALKNWHVYQGFPDPTQHPAIQKTMVGINRIHGKPKLKAHPLLPHDLKTIAAHLAADQSLAAVRDNALLQVGFFAALRRSELVAIEHQHLDWQEQGVDILLPSSKTDQAHQGQFSAIVPGKGVLCAVNALKAWLELSEIRNGYVFREIKKGQKLTDHALSPLAVNYILKKRAHQCGLAFAEKLSGHSLRRGLATSASLAGAKLSAIMRQGRWKNLNTVMEYVEASERFSDNVGLQIVDMV